MKKKRRSFENFSGTFQKKVCCLCVGFSNQEEKEKLSLSLSQIKVRGFIEWEF